MANDATNEMLKRAVCLMSETDVNEHAQSQVNKMVDKITEIANENREWCSNSMNMFNASVEAFRRMEQNNAQFVSEWKAEGKRALENGPEHAQPLFDSYYDTLKQVITEQSQQQQQQQQQLQPPQNPDNQLPGDRPPN